jgi:hypothetical protein
MRNFDKPLRTTAWSSTSRILIVMFAPCISAQAAVSGGVTTVAHRRRRRCEHGWNS